MIRGIKKRAALCRDGDDHARCVFPTAEDAKEYHDWERHSSREVKRLFNRQERLVLYLHYAYKADRRRIRNMTGINERKIRRILYDAIEMYRYDQSYNFDSSYAKFDFKYSVKNR